jgi:putative ABC transport system permease protein
MSVSKSARKEAASNGKLSPSATRTLPRAKKYRRRRGLLALFQSWGSALEAIRANKTRSLLTALGIIIGVAAVIMVVAISESNSAVINQRLSSALNPNELVIRSGSATSGGIRQGAGTVTTLTSANADAISAQVPHVSEVSPVVNANGQVIFQNQNWSTTIQGVYPDYQQVGNWTMQEGNFFSTADEQGGTAVAVVGQTVVNNLFTPLGIDPIGQQIRIRNTEFTVVGVLNGKGANGGFNDPDDVVYIPLATAQAQFTGSHSVNSIDVIVDDSSNVTSTQNAVEQVMEQQHNISDPSLDDFTIQNQSQILQTVQSTSQTLAELLISVAAISLIVGGIGIMNIMLVSVTERTREIGIRIAIGAHPGHVMTQFLVEAFMLSTLGGIVGIAIGIAGSYIISIVNGNPFALSPFAVLVAFLFSAVVGIAFGFYPARRAARLDPIVALRTE